MPVTSAVPSLSQITAWDVEHLGTAATSWSNTADLWEGAFDAVAQVFSGSRGIQWEGSGADSAQSRALSDSGKVRAAADGLRISSTIARHAAAELADLRRQVLNAVGEAHAQGFAVGEDLSVRDKLASSTLTEAAERLALARAFSSEIQARAVELVNVDREHASQIVSAATSLGELVFTESPTEDPQGGTFQAVDFSESPEPSEPAAPQPPRGLPPEGVQPPIGGQLAPGPASRPSEERKGGQSLWDENGGEWRYFPGDRYHNPHWDFNPHDAPHSPWENVPIGNLPPVKGNSVVGDIAPWLESPSTTDVPGSTQNPLLAPYPGAQLPTASPSVSLPDSAPVDLAPDVSIPSPNPGDLESAGAAGTGVVAGGGLLALLYMSLFQN